jgi:hypothetical protein
MTPRIQHLLLPLLLLALLISPALAAPPSSTPALKPSIGINLNGPADWNTEIPFNDVFRLSREWISQKRGESWGKGPKLDLDEHGWIKHLDPDCFAETPLLTIDGDHRPAGTYTILYKGKGKIELNTGKVVSDEPGKLTVDLGAGGGFFLRILETDPADYIRDIRVLLPDVKPDDKQPFRQGFLDTWRGVSTLRFMDWQQTNNSKQQKWASRPKVDDATWTTAGGIPIEICCDLANELSADAWFCIPHQADDDYVRQFATLVKSRLKPHLKVYLEYSNEVWNGQFEQCHYAGREGQKLKLAEKPWEAGWKYTGVRSKQIFAIWDGVFGAEARTRLVRVLASQSANAYVAGQILASDDAYKSADALAIAPYISFNVPQQSDQPDGLTADKVAAMSLEQILEHMEKHSLPESIKWIEDNATVAKEHHLSLVSYEAGQHMVGVQGGENNDTLTKLFHEANRSARMGEIYRQYFAAWEKAGGSTMCMFASTGAWSKWGSWGLMQFYNDKPADYPKMQATLEQAKKWGQTMTAR